MEVQMEQIRLNLKERSVLLKKALKKAKQENGIFPEGRLRVNHCKNRTRYYCVTNGREYGGEYIPSANYELAESLAQKSYNEKFIEAAQNELMIIEKFMNKLLENNADHAYFDLHEKRKILVEPYIVTDQMYTEDWQNKTFKTNSYMPDAKIYDTRKGEKVRSKSEAILADIFFELNIPYHYEKPLNLKSAGIRYPDFTLLRYDRAEIYLEHFGLMDDEEYRNHCFKKLDEYRQNGIYPGKNLLMTFESESNPLDIKGIRKMIKDFFKR